MARPLRMELAGGPYYVTPRGDCREAIYFTDEDREAWLDVLERICDRFNWRRHAWCQMANHYHPLVETPDASLSRAMRQLNGVYTQYVNRKHARVGAPAFGDAFGVHYSTVSRAVRRAEMNDCKT